MYAATHKQYETMKQQGDPKNIARLVYQLRAAPLIKVRISHIVSFITTVEIATLIRCIGSVSSTARYTASPAMRRTLNVDRSIDDTDDFFAHAIFIARNSLSICPT